MHAKLLALPCGHQCMHVCRLLLCTVIGLANYTAQLPAPRCSCKSQNSSCFQPTAVRTPSDRRCRACAPKAGRPLMAHLWPVSAMRPVARGACLSSFHYLLAWPSQPPVQNARSRTSLLLNPPAVSGWGDPGTFWPHAQSRRRLASFWLYWSPQKEREKESISHLTFPAAQG